MREAETYGLEALTPQLEQWRKQGLTVVFTNGVFDVLHVGHVAILEAAARHGQRLVVGVNSDASVRRLGKGADRPIQSELNRATLIGALRCVDAVVVFGEDTPLSVVQHLKPDVLVKGATTTPFVRTHRTRGTCRERRSEGLGRPSCGCASGARTKHLCHFGQNQNVLNAKTPDRSQAF